MRPPQLDKSGKNWLAWRGTVQLQLSSKGLFEYATGLYPRPDDPREADDFDWDVIEADTALLASYNTDVKAVRDWEAIDSKARLHIIQGLPPNLAGFGLPAGRAPCDGGHA